MPDQTKNALLDHAFLSFGLMISDVVEHLENSSPLIVEEIHRWRDLLWDDWIEYQREEERRKKLVVP